MTEKQLAELAAKEVRKLKKNATEQELSRLDLECLNPDGSENCIYGQMTGSCWSARAWQLLRECTATPLSSYGVPQPQEITDRGIEPIVEDLYKESTFGHESDSFGRRGRTRFSALEIYISLYRHTEKVERIINYLKGETTKLDLK